MTTRYVVQWEDGHFTVESAENAEDFKSKFLEPNLQNVRKAEYDRLVSFERPVDASSEGTVTPQGALDTWGQTMVGADLVWGQGVYGDGVLVGVVDSFVDINHPQISPRIAVNAGEIPGNGKDDDGNGYIDDVYGYSFVSNPNTDGKVSDHGTHVSGIIAADHQTGTIKGLAPKAKIIPAPFIDPVNFGSIGDAILAMQYVSQRGARIINASWGGAPCMASLRNAFQELNNKGILVVVAAGNAGHDIDYEPDYPAAFNMPNQLTVAAATPSDLMASWSNSGFNLVHLAAPGASILSTIPNNRTAFMDGTSMAAPFVTGAAALLWSDRPKATALQVKKALLTSVDVTPNHEYKVQTLGRMNVNKALAALRQLVP
jgi:subtilisin family serine protease